MVNDEEYQMMKEKARKRGINLSVIGAILIIAGGGIFVWGITSLSDIGIGDMDFSFMWKMVGGGAVLGIGAIVLGVGVYFYMASKMDKIAKFYSRATAPAAKYTTEQVTDGLASGLKKHGMGIGIGGKEVVKIKCRNCGYLETEDAEFCSKCGQTM